MRAAVWWIVGVALVATGAVPVARAEGANGNGNGHANGRLPAGPLIEIWKADRRLELRQGELVLRSFKVALGQAPREGKQYRGDMRTPVGRYVVSEKKPQSRFHRFLGLNYPNLDDAERGYRVGLIDAGQWADIFFANWRGETPPAHTFLGGRIGIHGYGGRPYLPIDWTEGCIAVSNEDVDYLYGLVPVGTPVIINE